MFLELRFFLFFPTTWCFFFFLPQETFFEQSKLDKTKIKENEIKNFEGKVLGRTFCVICDIN